MCNVYTTNVEALVQLVQNLNRPNLRELGRVYPNYEAPIFRQAADVASLIVSEVGCGVSMGCRRWHRAPAI